MKDAFDRTRPQGSRWDQEGAEFVDSDSEWCDRCAARMLALHSGLDYRLAVSSALELSSNGALRALAPEGVAEDLLRANIALPLGKR